MEIVNRATEPNLSPRAWRVFIMTKNREVGNTAILRVKAKALNMLLFKKIRETLEFFLFRNVNSYIL